MELFTEPLIDQYTINEMLEGVDTGTFFQPSIVGGNIDGAKFNNMFDAIVGKGSEYKFNSLSAALKAGHKTIYITNGTYNETGMGYFVPVSDTYIVGESRSGVIIQLGTRDWFEIFEYDLETGSIGGAPRSIAITQGDATVVGTGTTFTNLSAGNDIVIRGLPYEISSITDDTHLELTHPYIGKPGSGLMFIAGEFIKNLTFKNFTIQHTQDGSDYTFSCNGIISSLFEDLTIEIIPVSSAGGHPFYISYSADVTVRNCELKGKMDNGLLVFADNCMFINNKIYNAYGEGIYISGEYNRIIGNHVVDCEDGGIYTIEGSLPFTHNIISSNTIAGCGYFGISIDGHYNSVIGNTCRDNYYDFYNNVDEVNFLEGNTGRKDFYHEKYISLRNSSGGSVGRGDVVIFQITGVTSFTTTTTGGDNLVCGVVTETIANNGYGYVQIYGYMKTVKVDGTTDIAAGDFLSTFTTAGIAKKASAGETAFAIADATYTANDSNGIIDAFIISPRLI